MITLYGISNCDSMRKTRKWLDANAGDYSFHDYRKQGCDAALIDELLHHFDYTELINRRGTTWRNLTEAEKNTLDKRSARRLMQANPALIKRPILNINRQWILGYDTQRMLELINATERTRT